MPLRAVPALIDRQSHPSMGEAAKAAFLKRVLTRVLRAYPLLHALMGSAAEVDIAQMMVQLYSTLRKTTIKLLSTPGCRSRAFLEGLRGQDYGRGSRRLGSSSESEDDD